MNKGFFTENIKITRGDEKKKTVKKPTASKATCESCGLSHECKSPKMGVQGKGAKKILLIISQPGSSDDRNGWYLSGQSGTIIRDMLSELNIKPNRDCFITSAIQCYTEDAIKGKHTNACFKKISKIIQELKPKVIITFGKEAINSLVLHKLTGRLSGISLNDWVGYQIPDQEYKCFICPTWESSKLLTDRDQINPVVKMQIQAQFISALNLLSKQFPIYKFDPFVTVVTSKENAITLIKNTIKHVKTIAIDYETTGIKPHRDGHEIYTAAFYNGTTAYAFPFFNDEEFRNAWKELMQSDVKKICHNAKYEYNWTKFRANFNNEGGYYIKNIISDTMLDAHIIANTKKINLKFLTYVNFGIAGYDSEVDHFLHASQEEVDKYGANAINRIKEADINDVLLYNAFDPLFTYKIWEIQQKLLIQNVTKIGSEFFLDSSLELAKAENIGVMLDEKNARIQYKKLSNDMDNAEKTIFDSKEIKKWDKPKQFRVSAPGDLTHLLFKCMKLKPNKDDLTPTGKPKSDIGALEKYDNQIVKSVLAWRKLKKIRDTYLNGFLKEATDGVIHTSLNLGTVDTFRSSCNDPNLQNIPVRDYEVMQVLRKLIISRKNHKLAEYDYKAMEAVLIACYNKDPNWIRYVSDVNNDMHRDMGARIYIRKTKDVLKEERQCAKSSFVFPTVYGSYWKNTAVNLWNNCEDVTREHLRSEGIRNINDMREHVQQVEKWFWEDQFPVGYEWMKKTIKDYEKKGYIDLLSGFRCYGPMTRNQIINYRVQGTASHCKLWTLNKVSKLITKKKMNSRIILEIHDSIIPDIDPAEESYLDYQMWLYGTQKIREEWPWIIVPLFIEKKVSKVNGSWAEMENMGLLKGEK